MEKLSKILALVVYIVSVTFEIFVGIYLLFVAVVYIKYGVVATMDVYGFIIISSFALGASLLLSTGFGYEGIVMKISRWLSFDETAEFEYVEEFKNI